MAPDATAMDNTPILATKFYQPALREGLVIRPRLHYKLSENLHSRLMLITAPAGAGKTTLVTSWLAKQSRPAAWVSLDKYDNEPLVFLSYIAAAVHQIEAGVCQTIHPLLISSEPPPIPALLTYFVNDLACLEEPAILILDDYHTITAAKVDEVTKFLIENKPLALQIIITSRTIPNLPISRWRARNEIVEIDATDLRFNYDEAWHFLQDSMRLEISDKAVATLHDRTEGWVTGLQLAALGLRSQPVTGDEFVHEMSGDDRLIGDYLVDEVIARQPLEVGKFLERTSILNRLSADLCNTILKINNSQDILAYLERANLFLVPLDNRRIWYRYHHLFGDLLRSRLDHNNPDLVPTLYQRTIQWHAQNNLVFEAVEYAIAVEEYEQAADLIENNLDHLRTASDHSRLQRWAESISDSVLKEHDVLWSQYILTLFYFADFDVALETLRRLWHEGPVPPEKTQVVRAIEYPLMAAITLHTTLDASKVRQLTRDALAIMPEENQLMRGIAMGHYGSASMYLGDLASAREYLTEALYLLRGVFSLAIVTVFRQYYAETLATAGELRLALQEYEANQKFVYDHGTHEGNSFANTLIGLAMMYYEWNRLDEAQELVWEGARLADEGRYIEIKLLACRAMLMLGLAKQEPPDIRVKLDQIELAAQDFYDPPLVIDRLAGLRALLALHAGHQSHAELWAQRFVHDHQGQVSALQQAEWLAVVQIKREQGLEAEALELLQALLDMAEQQKRQRDVIRISALLTCTLYELGEKDRALLLLQEILVAAQKEMYVRSFVDAGPPMRKILGKVRAANSRLSSPSPSPTYIDHLLAAFPEETAPQASAESVPLTPRETEILGLLVEDLTPVQIADQLAISENTVKTHLKRIYSKLEVNNRLQAVLTAQDLGLL